MLKVCIIDNSELIRERLEEMLSENNITPVGTTDSVPGAKKLLAKFMPDLIILDIYLNLGNGFEVIEYAKKNNPDTNIIVFSITSSDQIKFKAYEKGAGYFFDKSTDYPALVHLIKDINHKQHKSRTA